MHTLPKAKRALQGSFPPSGQPSVFTQMVRISPARPSNTVSIHIATQDLSHTASEAAAGPRLYYGDQGNCVVGGEGLKKWPVERESAETKPSLYHSNNKWWVGLTPLLHNYLIVIIWANCDHFAQSREFEANVTSVATNRKLITWVSICLVEANKVSTWARRYNIKNKHGKRHVGYLDLGQVLPF